MRKFILIAGFVLASAAAQAGKGATQEPVVTGSVGAEEAWAPAAGYDEDHPDELSYRPFPLAPLLTASASPDDPALAKMVHPDAAMTLELLDDVGEILPMRFRPGAQVASLVWAHEFQGQAVSLAELEAAEPPAPRPARLSEKSVRTLPR